MFIKSIHVLHIVYLLHIYIKNSISLNIFFKNNIFILLKTILKCNN
jgi:hypothetical protein